MNLKVNKDICVGCGACQAICPNVYEIDVDGLATVKSQPTEINMEDAIDAKEGCPVGAIEEVNENGEINE